MKQYRITTENILQDSPDDCFLAPDDPIQELKISHHLGGLGSAHRLAEYNANNLPKIPQMSAIELAYKKTLPPGTDEWFKYHFSRNYANN